MALYPMPFNNPYTYAGHGGIDYGQREGTPVRAVADGQITFSGRWNDRAGLTRTLTVAGGLQMMHCHLTNLNGPAVGKWVKAGEVIAYVGWTGRVVPAGPAGSHLHHELWLRGVKQTGANYWKWIDRNRVITPSGSGSGGGGGTPTPTPSVPKITEEEDMKVLYITDDVDGNGRPGWALYNTRTGKWYPLVNDGKQSTQDNANSWGRALGQPQAYFCTRLDALNLAAGIRYTS